MNLVKDCLFLYYLDSKTSWHGLKSRGLSSKLTFFVVKTLYIKYKFVFDTFVRGYKEISVKVTFERNVREERKRI